MGYKRWRIGLIVLIVGLLAFGGAMVGLAGYPGTCDGPLVAPTKNPNDDGNPQSFESLGVEVGEDCYETKIDIDTDADLAGSVELGGYTVYYEIYGDDEQYFRFWNEEGLDVVQAVIIKGGPHANLYDYAGVWGGDNYSSAVSKDCNLVSPEHPNPGDIPGVSHFNILVCPPPTGCLQILKTWDYEIAGLELPEEIVFTIEGPGDVGVLDPVILDGTETDEQDRWVKTICDLPLGDYVVTEVTIDGWTSDIPDEGIILTVEAGDIPGELAIAEVTNTPDLGYLKVFKSFDGYPDHDDFTLPTAQAQVTGPYDFDETLDLVWDGDAGYFVAKFGPMAPGDYLVEEVNVDRDVWDVSYPGGQTATVTAGEQEDAVEIYIENDFRLGCLKITKEWLYEEETGDMIPLPDLPEYIKVLIEGPSFDPDGEVVTIEADAEGNWSYETCYILIPGTYTVTELEYAEGYAFGDAWTAVYVVDGISYVDSAEVEVIGGEQAEVTINNYFLFKDETIWAYSAYAYDELVKRGEEVPGVVYHNSGVPGNPSNAWGWTNKLTVADAVYDDLTETYEFYLFAGAGQNDTERGEMVGTLTVFVEEDGEKYKATVNYIVDLPYTISEYHLWVGDTPLPMVSRGRNEVPTAAPGQFPYTDGATVSNLDDGFYVSAHGVVRIPYTP